MFAQVFVVHTNPSPRKTHSAANQMKRVQGDESPWRSLGRVAPAYSPRKTRQSQYDHAKAHLRPTADSVPRLFRFPAFPRLLRPPSGSPHENAQSRSEPTKPDNHATSENARMAISTHGGIGTQHIASRSVWRYAANSRRDRTQDIPRGTHDRRDRTQTIPIETHDRCDRTQDIPIGTYDRRDRTQDIPRGTYDRREPDERHFDRTSPPRRTAPARTIPSAGAKTGGTQHCAGPQFTNL